MRIKNPSDDYILANPNFESFKERMDFFITVYSSPTIEVKIPDFELNKFLIEILKEEVNGLILGKIKTIRRIEQMLNKIYLIYKKKPKDYNKLIEFEQKIGRNLFFNKRIGRFYRHRFL